MADDRIFGPLFKRGVFCKPNKLFGLKLSRYSFYLAALPFPRVSRFIRIYLDPVAIWFSEIEGFTKSMVRPALKRHPIEKEVAEENC